MDVRHWQEIFSEEIILHFKFQQKWKDLEPKRDISFYENAVTGSP